MPKVAIATIDSAPRLAAADCDGEQFEGSVHTLALLAGSRHPLHARLHRMRGGARITWPASDSGFLAYVWAGSFDVDGHRLEVGSILAVEHHASAVAESCADGSALLVFNGTVGVAERAGGHVHLLPADRVPRTDRLVSYREGVGGALFADAACPTCEMWLHENSFAIPGEKIAVHSHSEDEIMVVTEGEIVLGARSHGRGTVIAVAAETLYGFSVGANGLTFINFRPKRPTYRALGAAGSIDEQAIFRGKLGSPQFLSTVAR